MGNPRTRAPDAPGRSVWMDARDKDADRGREKEVTLTGGTWRVQKVTRTHLTCRYHHTKIERESTYDWWTTVKEYDEYKNYKISLHYL